MMDEKTRVTLYMSLTLWVRHPKWEQQRFDHKILHHSNLFNEIPTQFLGTLKSCSWSLLHSWSPSVGLQPFRNQPLPPEVSWECCWWYCGIFSWSSPRQLGYSFHCRTSDGEQLKNSWSLVIRDKFCNNLRLMLTSPFCKQFVKIFLQ